MDARRLKPVMAKRACAVGKRERHDYEITAFNGSNIFANIFNHTYRFVSHHAAGIGALHFLIGPQIAPANTRARNANDSISRLDDFRVGHVLDLNVAGAIHYSCFLNLVSLISKTRYQSRTGISHRTSAASRKPG